MGAFGGFLGGLAGGLQKKNQGQGSLGVPAPDVQPKQQAQPAAPAQPSGTAQQPVNTQTQQSGFHGLVPMVQNYYANHQAKAEDAQANTHMQALQQAGITPEQRAYHIAQIQQIYRNRPQVLQQMGIPVPGAYNVPAVPAGGK